MKIHSLNCATFCPVGLSNLKTELEKFQENHLGQKAGSFLSRFDIVKKISAIPTLTERLDRLKDLSQDFLQLDLEKENIFSENFKELITNVLVIESNKKLILVDTGIGKKQIHEKNSSLKNVMAGLLTGLQYNDGLTAHEQIRQLGFSPTDVTDVIITHFDMDHVGGLSDFPQATAHLFEIELKSANDPKTSYEKKRYFKELWENHKNFSLYHSLGEEFHGFSLTPMEQIQEDIFLVHLPGHTRGQAGVYLKEKNTLLAGDSYVNQIQIEGNYTPLPIRLYKKMTTTDEPALERTLQGLRRMCAAGVHVGCSHDKHQFLKLKPHLEK